MGHTGKKRKDGIHGLPLFLLSIYQQTYPKATRYECTAYLYQTYGSTLALTRIYSLNDITEADNHIGLNRKKGSTTANQAFTHRNLTRRLRYWTMNFPDGIADIAREDMIDLDEAGLSLGTANRRYRKCSILGRVQERGNYGHGVNHTLKMAISGSSNGIARRWIRFDTGGTDVLSFIAFSRDILRDIGQGTHGNRKCIIMDNLLVHTNANILGEILAAGHRYVFRAPYYPVDGPIEYVFNTIENSLAYRMHEIDTVGDLNTHVRAIVQQMPSFVNYFTNCGYR